MVRILFLLCSLFFALINTNANAITFKRKMIHKVAHKYKIKEQKNEQSKHLKRHALQETHEAETVVKNDGEKFIEDVEIAKADLKMLNKLEKAAKSTLNSLLENRKRGLLHYTIINNEILKIRNTIKTIERAIKVKRNQIFRGEGNE